MSAASPAEYGVFSVSYCCERGNIQVHVHDYSLLFHTYRVAGEKSNYLLLPFSVSYRFPRTVLSQSAPESGPLDFID